MIMRTHVFNDVDPYPILMCRPEEAMGKVKALYDKGEHYDIVLFDMSGTINNPGVAKTVSLMDYIFIPVTADKILYSCPEYGRRPSHRTHGTGQQNLRHRNHCQISLP